jgi:hypothetical protein
MGNAAIDPDGGGDRSVRFPRRSEVEIALLMNIQAYDRSTGSASIGS